MVRLLPRALGEQCVDPLGVRAHAQASVDLATSIQRTIEGIPLLCESRPDLDLAARARELVTLFELATRNCP
jgi:hypothetical protein